MDEWKALRYGITTAQDALLRNAEVIRSLLQADPENPALQHALRAIESALLEYKQSQDDTAL